MKTSKQFALAALAGVLFCGLAFAQGPDGPGPGSPGGMAFRGPAPMDHMFHDRRFGHWWNDPQLAQQIGITDQQKHQMDDIFLQHRLKLIDLNGNLEKQELLLHPMIEADQPDETKILAQIDAVAQARAELEKADARMLFDVRKTLTPDQWQKLKSLHSERHDRMMMRHHRDGNWGPQHRHGMGPDGAAPSTPPAQPNTTPQAPPQ